MDAFVVAGVPLHRDVDFCRIGCVFEGDDALEDWFLRGVEVSDEVGDATRVLEDLFVDGLGPLVPETDLEALVQEGHLAKALEQGLRAELRGLLEDRCVRPEGDRGALLVRRALLFEAAGWLPTVGEAHLPAVALPVDLEVEA